jgi:serine/threonine-protein kinase
MTRGLRIAVYLAAFFAATGLSAYTTLVLVVRQKPEIAVPRVVGLDAVTALKTLSEAGLQMAVAAEDHHDQAPAGRVVSQDPPAGGRIRSGRVVRVVLSLGPARIKLPDLRGLARDQAQRLLEQTGMRLGLVSQTYSPEVSRDRIMAQAPPPLTPLAAGAGVDVLVSLGPAPEYIAMPDMTGLSLQRALAELEKAGLSLEEVTGEDRPNWPDNAVLFHDPPAGVRTARGYGVRLTVNGPAETDRAPLRFRLVQYDVPPGLLPHRVSILAVTRGRTVVLDRGLEPPGKTVRAAVLTRGPATIRINDNGVETDFALSGADQWRD